MIIQYLQLSVRCSPEFSEVLIAELAELGFDVFEESSDGFSAFAEENQPDFDACKELLEKYAEFTALSYSVRKVDRQNWNSEWENNYPPVVIDEAILIHTDFHKIEKTYPYHIRITPKMSFGTGHHATTSQMLSFLLQFPVQGLRVVDAGCGTGILAIMAEKCGASEVTGFDHDAWCIENSEENFQLNHCKNCKALLASGISILGPEPADLILANINKNIILQELPDYYRFLQPGGSLFLSGFYSSDVADIHEIAIRTGLELHAQSEKENWACLVYRKPL